MISNVTHVLQFTSINFNNKTIVFNEIQGKTEKQTCFTVWSSSSGMPKRMNRHSNKKLLFCCCLLCLQARNKSHLDILKPSRIAAILFVQPSFFVEQRTYFCIGHSKYVRVPSFAKKQNPDFLASTKVINRKHRKYSNEFAPFCFWAHRAVRAILLKYLLLSVFFIFSWTKQIQN